MSGWLAGFLAGLVLALVLGAAWLLNFLAGLVEDSLEGTQQVHIDFSARVELPAPRPELQREDAPLVLFLHETSAGGSAYTKYLGFLEERGYRVRAPDIPEPDLSKVSQALTIFATPVQIEATRKALRAAAGEAGDAPLFLFGISRGASLAVLAMDQEPDVEVAGVVLDGFFSSREVLETMIRRFAPIYLGRAGHHVPRWIRRWTAGMGLDRVEARLGLTFPESLPALRRLRAPALFLHGGKDRTAPVEDVPEYVEAAGSGAELVVIKKARHNRSCLKDPERYRRAVLEFLESRGGGLGEDQAELASAVGGGGGGGG